MGVATAYLANQRGRDPYIWFALGVVFGLLALFLLFVLPAVKSEKEWEDDQKNEILVERREEQLKEQEKLENAPDLQPQSIEAKDWFYLDKARQQRGPLSFYVVNELWQGGEIDVQTLIWTEGMAEWKKVQEVPQLNEVLMRSQNESRNTSHEEH